MNSLKTLLALFGALLALTAPASAAELDAETAAKLVDPPYALGESIGDGAWELVNLDGRVAGYGFETVPLAPLPGFSGAPIDLFVQVTTEGRFIEVDLVAHNEPIFVSGLGEAPFKRFVEQYRGHSIHDSLVVGVPYGEGGSGSSLVYLEGVTKATASVRIAHESILAAAFAVAREKMGGMGARRKLRPLQEVSEELDWQDLVDRGIATRRTVTNAEVDAAFEGTLWEDDDPETKADPQGVFLDLWIVDVGPAAIARAVLAPDTLQALQRFMSVSTEDEPILLIEAGRHGLVGPDFVPNTSPDLVAVTQDGLPVAIRDADIFVETLPGVPQGVAMILRTDRRIGFDPAREWQIAVRAVREHGSFRPEIGTADFTATHKTDIAFFEEFGVVKAEAPWKQALRSRAADLVVLGSFLAVLTGVLLFAMRPLASHRHYTPIRLAVLAVVIGFIGWWGQGQLSIVTPLAVARGLAQGQSMEFLLYDPFSLLIWGVVILSFVAWGRGYFCGWLCPFGAMQEFSHHAGRLLRLPQIRVPDRIDRVLVNAKYVVLAALVATAFASPALNDKLVEVEPFKTAVTTYFIRDWPYVLYAVGLIALSSMLFKGFCRYVCPLGAVMAIGGLVRGRDWIERRKECGSPCQLCKVRCNYNAIRKNGSIRYDECFQCLDCVTIHADARQCVPLVLAARGRKL